MHTRRRTTTRRLATLLAAGASVLALAACNPGKPDPTSTTTTSTSPSSTSTPSTSTTPPNAEQQAYTTAEAAYRRWVASVKAAYPTFNLAKLDKADTTAQVYQAYVTAWTTPTPAGTGGITGHFKQSITSITGNGYDMTRKWAQLDVCAVQDVRFLDKNGKDVTTLKSNGKPAPINTTARHFTVQFLTSDGGKTWKVATWTDWAGDGPTC